MAAGSSDSVEHELMAQFDCARMTVNKAMSGLAVAGLIERRRRAGSFVAQQRIRSAVLEIPDIAAEITGRGEQYGYELLFRAQRVVTRDDLLVSALLAGQQVLELTCRHKADARPFALEYRLINLAAVPEAAHIDFSITSPGPWLLDHVAWTEVEHRITAANADAAVSARLGIPKKNACLVVERRTWRGGVTVTFVRQIFPADLYHFAARSKPSGRPAV
jgi:GntR family transcriptional regulator, histidine utilization repressor